jgi:hypothetical protein
MTTQADDEATNTNCAMPGCRGRTDGSMFCTEHRPGYRVGTPHPSIERPRAYTGDAYLPSRPAPSVTIKKRKELER